MKTHSLALALTLFACGGNCFAKDLLPVPPQLKVGSYVPAPGSNDQNCYEGDVRLTSKKSVIEVNAFYNISLVRKVSVVEDVDPSCTDTSEMTEEAATNATVLTETLSQVCTTHPKMVLQRRQWRIANDSITLNVFDRAHNQPRLDCAWFFKN